MRLIRENAVRFEPGVDPGLMKIVKSCLRVDSEKRPTAAEILNDRQKKAIYDSCR